AFMRASAAHHVGDLVDHRRLYQNPAMVNEITDVMRRAGTHEGIDEPWIRAGVPMQGCPACGEKLRPPAAICKSCGAILDRRKAIEFGLLKDEALDATAEPEAEPAKKRAAKKVA